MNSDRRSADFQEVKPFYCYGDRTLALLRRYFRMSLQIGKLPALLGREVFRARVTSYRMTTFEDAVIFVHDMDCCLEKLCRQSQEVIARIVFEEYTCKEVAQALHVGKSSIHRRYERALDELSEILLCVKILTPIGERPVANGELPPNKPAARVELEACASGARAHVAVSNCAVCNY